MSVSLEEYFRTTFEDKLLVKMPEREDDHLTPATRLLEKRREMSEVEQALAAQKEEFQMKMESLQQRREELERKEFQLKESLLKFDKFLKENDSKRARAVKKANDERDLKRVKDREIGRLFDETGTFAGQKQKLHDRLEKHAMFHKYLEKVLESAEEFHEIREVIARYDTLVATHKDLLEKDHENQDLIEDQKQEFSHFMENKHNQILGYNNQLSGLQTRLDRAQSEAVKWEAVWTHIKNTAAKKTLLLGRIKMASHNLYQLVNRQQKGPSTQSEDTAEQLQKIQIFIQDLSQITSDIKRSEHMGTSVAGGTSSG
ncbi:unnamed protein product [Owenia fusiformis]|uniref:DUF4200 domain-containing protein n=1 Tax=Owenia fusiformis TaxID=6347 RepID=A0A8S4Q7G4_OWEFU|nr:unnamed protein product [Owenia fusiformis]